MPWHTAAHLSPERGVGVPSPRCARAESQVLTKQQPNRDQHTLTVSFSGLILLLFCPLGMLLHLLSLYLLYSQLACLSSLITEQTIAVIQ